MKKKLTQIALMALAIGSILPGCGEPKTSASTENSDQSSSQTSYSGKKGSTKMGF